MSLLATCRYSFSLKQDGLNIHDEPQFTVFGKSMALGAAQRLLSLSSAQIETETDIAIVREVKQQVDDAMKQSRGEQEAVDTTPPS